MNDAQTTITVNEFRTTEDFLQRIHAAASNILMRGQQPWTFKEPELLSLNRFINLRDLFVVTISAISGDIAEFGTFRGEASAQLAKWASVHVPNLHFHLFDWFGGIPEPRVEDGTRTASTAHADAWHKTSRAEIEATMGDLINYTIHGGMFADFKEVFKHPLAFAHIDGDLYQSTLDALEIAMPLVIEGGVLVIDDYATADWPGVKQACEEILCPNKQWRLIPWIGQAFALRVPENYDKLCKEYTKERKNES